MLAPPQRKRFRSPSPPPSPDHSSPLDILLKRRKRSLQYPDPPNPFDTITSTQAGPSSQPFSRFIEKRRTRQWEKQNAPLSTQSTSASSSDFGNSQPQIQYSQPEPSSPVRIQHHSASQSDDASRHVMSSSPIRHSPPSSSPFRDRGMRGLSSSVNTKVEEVEEGMMDEEEMRREWGDEYMVQNTLLHSLHLARTRTHNTDATPDNTFLHTPSLPSPSLGHQNLPNYFPPQPTPYRSTAWPSSSPYLTPYGQDPTMRGLEDGEDENMDVDGDLEMEKGDEETKNRYEEANRLLRELEVVRRQRWGEK